MNIENDKALEELREQIKLQEKLLKTQEAIANNYLKMSLSDKEKIISLLEEQIKVMVPLVKNISDTTPKYRGYIG